MATCFLFAKYLNNEGCLCLTLNQQGDIEAPLVWRNFKEIKQLQVNAMTMVVASTQYFGLHQIELPWLPEKKARAAIPFALEDQLAENVNELHFAFDRNHYLNGHYLVVVGKQSYLRDLITTLAQHEITFDTLTLDWFALNNRETCVMDTHLLVHNKPFFCGALSEELGPSYLEKVSDDQSIYIFTNSSPTLQPKMSQTIGMDSPVWIAKRLLDHKAINLSQGDFQQKNRATSTKRWYIAAATMSLLWLLSFLLGNGFRIYHLNSEIKTIDSEIATIYREFFPNASQVISPKFRINQLVKAQKNENDHVFWLLLNQLTEAVKHSKANVEQFRFQNQLLQVTVVSKDFDSLEAFQNALLKTPIKVKQSQASSHEGQVIATLELSL